MEIIMGKDKEKIVTMEIQNEDVHFLGIVKSCTEMTSDKEVLAKKFLNKLFERWTVDYDRVYWKNQAAEFRYESLKGLILVASKFEEENKNTLENYDMTITAVCMFPKKKKAFWLNTGSEMIYSFTGRNLQIIATQEKKLKTFADQSLFTRDKDYFLKTEGAVIKLPKFMYIVSADARNYFEKVVQKGKGVIAEEVEDALSLSQNKQIIICGI